MDNQDIIQKLETVSNLVRFFDFDPETVGINVTKNEMKTLMQIKFKNNQSLSYYSHKVGLKKGSFTSLTDNLLEKGLINKSFIKNDKRTKTISLSPKGTDLTEKFYKSLQVFLDVKLSKLSKNDRVLFESAINILEHITF